jgi:hypothetical protein
MHLTSIGFSARGVCVWILALLGSATSATSVRADITGKQNFEQNCAFCRGKDCKDHGEAPYVIPGIKPTDLTKLTRNRAVPIALVFRRMKGLLYR